MTSEKRILFHSKKIHKILSSLPSVLIFWILFKGIISSSSVRSFSQKLKKSLFITGREILSKKGTILELALHIVFRPNQHLSNKGIKQTRNYRRIVLIGYWSVQYNELWRGFSNRRLVVPPGLKPPVSIAKIGMTIFASFWQKKPWRQNRTPSPFFVIVSLSMRH